MATGAAKATGSGMATSSAMATGAAKAVTRPMVLRLYKDMIRQAKKFTSYNYREYAVRRIRDEFRSNRDLKDRMKIEAKFVKAAAGLEVIKRQVIIGQLYKGPKLIIESSAFVQNV